MKALYCLLIAALLTVTSYEADKVAQVVNGLEEYEENGLQVIIDDQQQYNKGQDTKAIMAKIELQLKKSGI